MTTKTTNRASPTTNKSDKRSETSPKNGKKGGRPPTLPPFQHTAAEFLVEKYYDDDADQPKLRHWRNSWYKYNGHGWKTTSEDDIRKSLITFMEDTQPGGDRMTNYHVTSVLTHLSGYNMCGLSGEHNAPIWLSSLREARNWVAFSNKTAVNVWNLAEGKGERQVTLTPDLFTMDTVEYAYDPKAKCPMFEKYLKRSLPNKESRDIVQEMLGLMLADTCKYEVFFYLYGPTARNGKTVLLNIMSALVGKHNVSHVSLDNITERFESWPLAETKVNIHGDMATDTGRSSLAHVEGLFKDLISGANIEYQKKGKDKFIVPCRARFVFAGNSLPTFVDRSDAIWERLRLVHFPVQIPKSERDPNLADKIIQKELPGIFNWAIQGLARVIKNNGVVDRKEGVELKQEHRLECDHEGKFLYEAGYVRGDPEDYVERTQLLASYQNWMKSNGYIPKGAGKFYKRVLALIPGVEERQMRVDKIKGPVKVFVGMKVEEM